MERLIITSEEDLTRLIRQALRDELGRLLPQLAENRTHPEETLMTRQEMAAYLRISLVTLTDWTHRGLPVHRKRKRGRVLFVKSEVLQWLKANPDVKTKKDRVDC